jgi:hypothetical protein
MNYIIGTAGAADALYKNHGKNGQQNQHQQPPGRLTPPKPQQQQQDRGKK